MRSLRSLQTRLLLGYGLILILATTPALFVAVRFASLNQQIQTLGADVSHEASAGTRLVARVAAVQQAVDRYLQQPQSAYLLAAQVALRDLTIELRDADGTISDPGRRQILANLATRQRAYQQAFEELSGMISARGPLLDSLNASLTRTDRVLSTLLIAALRRPNIGGTSADQLNDAQGHLRRANLLLVMMVSEQDDGLGAEVISALDEARRAVEPLATTAGKADQPGFTAVLRGITLTTSYTQQLIVSLDDIANRRDTLIGDEGLSLQEQAAQIEQTALASLVTAAAGLEQQSRQTQQLAGLALLALLLIAILLASSLAHQVTRPIGDLVASTAAISRGQYKPSPSRYSIYELVRLAEAFNQMGADLARQRDEVRRQQEGLARRYDELKQALANVRRADAERGAGEPLGEPASPDHSAEQ